MNAGALCTVHFCIQVNGWVMNDNVVMSASQPANQPVEAGEVVFILFAWDIGTGKRQNENTE